MCRSSGRSEGATPQVSVGTPVGNADRLCNVADSRTRGPLQREVLNQCIWKRVRSRWNLVLRNGDFFGLFPHYLMTKLMVECA